MMLNKAIDATPLSDPFATQAGTASSFNPGNNSLDIETLATISQDL